MMSLFSSCLINLIILEMIFTSEAQLPFEVQEGKAGVLRPNPLGKFDVPYVPEEFKSSPKVGTFLHSKN